MKKKNRWVCLGLILLLAVWIVFSNDIVAKLCPYSTVKTAMFSDFLGEGTPICAIDQFLPYGDMLETVGIQGWAYVPTQEDSRDCKTIMVLQNEEYCYELPFELPEDYENYVFLVRSDVIDANHLTHQTVGYAGEFATYMMENGIYDVYIYRWENENAYGIVHTEKQLVKQDADLRLRNWRCVAADKPAIPLEEETVRYSSLEASSVADGELMLSGWMFVRGKNSDKQQIYLNIKDEAGTDVWYTTLPTERADVANGQKDDRYIQCGFKGTISLDDIPDYAVTVTVFAEINGRLYRGDAYSMNLDKEQNLFTVNKIEE